MLNIELLGNDMDSNYLGRNTNSTAGSIGTQTSESFVSWTPDRYIVLGVLGILIVLLFLVAFSTWGYSEQPTASPASGAESASREEFVRNQMVLYQFHKDIESQQEQVNGESGRAEDSLRVGESFRVEDSIREDAVQCAICLEVFKEGEQVCTPQDKGCPHIFHMDCLGFWLMKHSDCPCCRRKILHRSVPPFESKRANAVGSGIEETA